MSDESDPSFIDGYTRFTTVPLKPKSDWKYRRYRRITDSKII